MPPHPSAKAFAAFTEELRSLPPALQADYEAKFQEAFGPAFYADWRAHRA